MRLMSTAVTMLLATATLATTVSLSHAQSCQSLWVERGINYFGNAGCRYDSENAVPLSRSARERIAEISRQEQRLGCN